MLKRILAIAAVCLLALPLAGCYEYRGPYTGADVEAYLAGRFPGEAVSVRRSGLQTWECRFDEVPEAVFHVRVGRGGGDPVPMFYSMLVSDAEEVIPAWYLEQYRAEGGGFDGWNLNGEYLSAVYTSMDEAGAAWEQLSAFYDWVGDRPLARLMPEGHYAYEPELPWHTWSPQFHNHQEMVVQGPEDEAEAAREALEDSVKKYRAFYCLPCQDFSQAELEEYAAEAWPWEPLPRVKRGEESLPPELLAGIGLESGVISYGGLYTLLLRLGFAVEGTPEHFAFTGADGCAYEFSYDFWEEREMDWVNNETITLPVWHCLRDGWPVEREGETGWMGRGPVIDLNDGWNIDTHNGHVYFYTPFWDITGLRAFWEP